jgi:hypothetical protein
MEKQQFAISFHDISFGDAASNNTIAQKCATKTLLWSKSKEIRAYASRLRTSCDRCRDSTILDLSVHTRVMEQNVTPSSGKTPNHNHFLMMNASCNDKSDTIIAIVTAL